MENVIAITAGVALRVVLDFATDNDHKLIGILIGLWEGVVLSHFLSKRTRSSRSKDPYLALATRLAIDLYRTHSLSRFALTCAWTLVGLLLADLAPGVWRDTGLRNVYKASRREIRAIRKLLPRWKIENDLRMPRISFNHSVPLLFSSRAPSSVVSSTRAMHPASPTPVPVPVRKRRTPPGTYPGHATLSETNTELSRAREVILGPSPAFISTNIDPTWLPSFGPHSSQRLPHPSDFDPSRHSPVTISDDNWVHVTVPSHSSEQAHEPELSVLVLGDSVVGRGARSEPIFSSRLDAGGGAFVGGFAVELSAMPEPFVDKGNQAGSFVSGRPATEFAVELSAMPEPFVDKGNQARSFVSGRPATEFAVELSAMPEPFVDKGNQAGSFVSRRPATESGGAPQYSPRRVESAVASQTPSANPLQAPTSVPDAPTMTGTRPQHFPGRVESVVASQTPSANPLQAPTSVPDASTMTGTRARSALGSEMGSVDVKNRPARGPVFPNDKPNTPPPPFNEVGTPIEPTLLTQEQADRESLRGEFLMRELKQLEVLVAKAESGATRGSPSALSVEKLNGIREKLARVRVRVDRRVFEDPPAEASNPPQLTLSGIGGPSAIDLVHTAIVDMLLDTPHAESLAVVGYINKQKKGNPKIMEMKTAVVDWVKENKFKVRTEPQTPFILIIMF